MKTEYDDDDDDDDDDGNALTRKNTWSVTRKMYCTYCKTLIIQTDTEYPNSHTYVSV
jgi:hypothetical protein